MQIQFSTQVYLAQYCRLYDFPLSTDTLMIVRADSFQSHKKHILIIANIIALCSEDHGNIALRESRFIISSQHDRRNSGARRMFQFKCFDQGRKPQNTHIRQTKHEHSCEHHVKPFGAEHVRGNWSGKLQRVIATEELCDLRETVCASNRTSHMGGYHFRKKDLVSVPFGLLHGVRDLSQIERLYEYCAGLYDRTTRTEEASGHGADVNSRSLSPIHSL